MAPAAIFTCSICGEPSGDICVFCTKDVCINHRCDRCKRCSDCCECEIPLSAAQAPTAVEVEAPAEPPVQPPSEAQEPLAAMPEPAGASENETADQPDEHLPPPQPEHPIF